MTTFKEDLEDDLYDVFFVGGVDEDFAEECSWKKGTDAECITLRCIYDNSYSEITPQGGGAFRMAAKVQSRSIRIHVPTSSIVGIGKGQTITVRGIVYDIITNEPNGVGVTTLTLHKKLED